MFLRMLKSKIHRAVVSDTNLHYEGSITIDTVLMNEAGILPYEEISVWNITNGERFNTYAVAGSPNSGEIVVNGAAAHKAKKGDIIIIAAFAYVEENKACNFSPVVILVDKSNCIQKKYNKIEPQVRVV